MAQAVRPSSARASRPPGATALARAPPLKSSFSGQQEAPSISRKDSKDAYKGQSMSEKVR